MHIIKDAAGIDQLPGNDKGMLTQTDKWMTWVERRDLGTGMPNHEGFHLDVVDIGVLMDNKPGTDVGALAWRNALSANIFDGKLGAC